MITNKAVPEGEGWTPMPNSGARDMRISRRALGLLVEVLSYPSGWDNSADAAAARGREGREATRTAMNELVEFGYVMRIRYSKGGGTWETEMFAALSELQCADLVEAWFVNNPNVRIDEKRSSYRRTGFRASENRASAGRASVSRASNRRLNKKTEVKTVEEDDPDTADAASSVDADASTFCGADAPRSERADQPESAKPKRQRRQSLGAYLKTLGTDAIDEMYWDLDATKSGLMEWTRKEARKDLSVPEGTWPDEADDQLTLKAVEIAAYTLRKRSYAEFGEVVEGYLDGFDWPPEKDSPQPATDASEGPLRYRHSPGFLYAGKGHEDACLARIHAAIDRMPVAELAESLKLFDAHRSQILEDCRRVAAKIASLHVGNGHDRQILHAAAEYWRDWHRDKAHTKWPMFVVPRELHSKQESATEAA